jgi:hypothetical protein
MGRFTLAGHERRDPVLALYSFIVEIEAPQARALALAVHSLTPHLRSGM